MTSDKSDKEWQKPFNTEIILPNELSPPPPQHTQPGISYAVPKTYLNKLCGKTNQEATIQIKKDVYFQKYILLSTFFIFNTIQL